MIGLHISFYKGVPFLWGEQANAKPKAEESLLIPFDPGVSDPQGSI